MTSNAPPLCSHCGHPLQDKAHTKPTASDSQAAPAHTDETREYDHRGVPMPQRTRVGGIITPQ